MVSTESQAAMDAAKKAVMEFMAKNGHHDTTIHEVVAPAVYHETITRSEHENLINVVEKELTQDHFHRTIQPITDEELLEVQHSSNVLPVENRTFEHDDVNEVRARLDTEQARFQSHVQRVDSEHTQTVVPVLDGQRYHHHVREIIQPVVTKHTIEPHVIHTTVLIREVHHQAAQHHATSALSPVSMKEFLKQGGVLSGREERYDYFEGEPRNVGGTLGTPHTNATSGASKTGSSGNAGAPLEHPVTVNAPAQSPSAAPQINLQRTPTMPAPAPADKPAPPTPSAAAVNEGSKIGEGREGLHAPTSTPRPGSPPTPAQPAQNPGAVPGRWNLLPMHFSKPGEGSTGALQPPTRAIQHSLEPTARPSQSQASAARPGQAPDQQGQQPRRTS